MCQPETTIARQDFEALAIKRGWTAGEIQQAWQWARGRKAKREEQSARKAELASLERQISDLRAKVTLLHAENEGAGA